MLPLRSHYAAAAVHAEPDRWLPGNASGIVEEATARSIVWKSSEMNRDARPLFDRPVATEVVEVSRNVSGCCGIDLDVGVCLASPKGVGVLDCQHRYGSLG